MRVERLDGGADLSACHEIRRTVFVVEQGVADDEEWDDLDGECTHFVALNPGPVGTARLRAMPGGVAKAQRVAVLRGARGQGVGAALMESLEAEARARGHREVQLGAQVGALGFYRSLGYEAYGAEFEEAGIPHRWMRKALAAETRAPGRST